MSLPISKNIGVSCEINFYRIESVWNWINRNRFNP